MFADGCSHAMSECKECERDVGKTGVKKVLFEVSGGEPMLENICWGSEKDGRKEAALGDYEHDGK